MANKDNLLKLVAQKLGPDQLKQMVDQAEQALSQDPDVTPEVISQMLNLFSQVAENPESYQSVIQEAIQAGVLDQGDFPEQFDPIFIGIFLLALQGLQQRAGQGFARGGLSQAAQQVQSQGRDSDTILAHISPHEAAFLKRLGGSGTINPQTGLMEFGIFKKIKNAVKSVVKAVAPIVKAVAPMVVGAITLNPYLAAATGAALGATGGGGLKGAVIGGLGGYLATPGNTLASTVGEYASKIPGISSLGLSNQVLGAGVLGGASSAVLGKNPITGALLSGAVANYAPGLVDKYGNTLPDGMAQSIATGAGAAANTGGGLKGTLTGGAAGALTNLAMSGLSDMGIEPSSTSTGASNYMDPNAPVNQMINGTDLQMPTYDPATGTYSTVPNYASPTAGIDFTGGNVSSAPADLMANYPTYSGGDATTGQGGTYSSAPTNVAPVDNSFSAQLAANQANLQANNPVVPTQAVVAPTAGPLTQAAGTPAAGAPSMKGASTGFNWSDMATMAGLATLIGGKTPKQANDAILQDPALTEQQKQGMLRQLTNYTLNYNKTTMPEQGTPEWDAFMSDLTQGKENVWANPTISENPTMARGGRTKRKPQGALSQVSRISQGAGDGRSDSIEARLSDGEYVIDAETVALLGNGSTKAGAAMLDQMRQGIRQQKGRALAKGKFSPDAKAPLAYMKGGLR
jgi:hypothetical protein